MKTLTYTCITAMLASAVAGAVTYPIVDTGQTQTYGNEKGQDAAYAGNAPSAPGSSAFFRELFLS